MNRAVLLAIAATLLVALQAPPHAQQLAGSPSDAAVVLAPTEHPRVSRDLSQLWMAPPKSSRAATDVELAKAVKFEIDAEYTKALPIVSQAPLLQGPLGTYAEYYKGVAELRLARPDEARRTFRSLQSRQPVGYLSEAAALREAEADEALLDPASALAIYERLSTLKTTAPEDVLLRLGRAAKAAGDADKARRAFARVYYEFPLSDLSAMAESELDTREPIAAGSTRYKLELGRAERLFSGKKYAHARSAFELIHGAAQGDDRELVNLRLAECDYFLRRPRNTREAMRPYIDRASRQAEALFFYAVATRDVGDYDDYLRTVRRLATEFPAQSWTEEALNNLATHYILLDDDESASQAFRELNERFPKGHYAERAAWKIGWWAYKNRRYAETVHLFERAAADFPRSDYRPAWLYWAGRAHDGLNEKTAAQARYTLVALDYLNSYYGRQAASRLDGRTPERRLIADTQPATDGEPAAVSFPPNEPIIRALLGVELYDQALDELRYAQKMWGDSPAIQATFAWTYNARGDLRPGITAMKRAYPQYLAAGGEKLPTEILKVLFPVEYWALIRRYSQQNGLDPYLVAALIAQESTFTADIRSAANAYGLMQLLPSTGRQYARKLGLARRFSLSLLTTAETNIRMGTAYFADKVKQFGGVHFALASYNAGENRVIRWMSERPGIERDEFIDDIPFPETQNYVKRIIGTADDYRRLYGPEAAGTSVAATERKAETRSGIGTTRKKAPAAAKKKTPVKPARRKSHKSA